MYFYRALQPIHAVTLDLDNTLYDNRPIMVRAELELALFLQKYHPALSEVRNKDYHHFRKIIRMLDPEIYHDANYWGWCALERALLQFGLTKYEAQLGANGAMEVMIHWRNQINVPCDTHKVLSALSSRWPLIAITNGNANPAFWGIRKYFEEILYSGIHGRAKPYTDMYFLAANRLGVPCKYILHVGDDLYADIQGAISAGMQSCWINQYNNMNRHGLVFNHQLYPNMEILELISLIKLL